MKTPFPLRTLLLAASLSLWLGPEPELLGTAPPPSFESWAASFGLAGASADAEADPDSDGLQSAAECILGGNPSQPSTSVRPALSLTGDSMLFTFSRLDARTLPTFP